MSLKKLFIFFAAMSVIAACDSQDGLGTAPLEVNPPTGVTLVSATTSTLTLSWDKVSGADLYTARLETSSGTLVNNGQIGVTDNTVKFEKLSADTEYLFKVRARVGKVLSVYSEPLSVSTLANGGAEPEPEPEPEPDPDPTPDPEPEPEPEPTPDPQPTPNEYYSMFKIPAVEDNHAKVLAFPGAEGGGMYTAGGRGGKVIHVTNLNDSGTGSLRAALSESGARTIVFDVAGIIDLKSVLKITEGDVTVAGQTAPGDGICLRNYTTNVDADNVIIRFVRFRMGDEKKHEGDAIEGRYHDNIVIDHCSMSWSTDECASFYANRNFTMQWCILTESLRMSVHGKGEHGYGGIWGGKNASFHHNLLANHDSRNPRIDHPQIYDSYIATHRGNVDVRCNAVYNWGDDVTYGGEDGWFNIVNNYYKPGENSSNRRYFVNAYGKYIKDGKMYADSYPQLYLSGNVNTKHSLPNDISSIYWHDGSSYGNYNTVLSSPLTLKGPQSQDVFTTVHTAAMSFERICASAGASLVRDVVDLRATSDALAGKNTITDGGNGSTGGLIDTQSAAGGWPAYNATAAEKERVKDSDGDGMPDWFEDMFGLKKSDSSDGNLKTLDSYGRYTNLEMYLHYLVKDIVEEQNRGGQYDKI